MNITDESEPFKFSHEGEEYTAYVRYYEDGDCDVELDYDNPQAHDKAWKIADLLGLFEMVNSERLKSNS